MGFDKLGKEQDAWAVGCLMAEMAVGKPLFCSLDSANQLYIAFRTLGFPSKQQVTHTSSAAAI